MGHPCLLLSLFLMPSPHTGDQLLTPSHGTLQHISSLQGGQGEDERPLLGRASDDTAMVFIC